MTSDHFIAIVSNLPSWELRAIVNASFIIPKRTSPREKRMAHAAQEVLRWREGQGAAHQDNL